MHQTLSPRAAPSRQAAEFVRAGRFGLTQIGTDAPAGSDVVAVLDDCLTQLHARMAGAGVTGGLVRLTLRLADIGGAGRARAALAARLGAQTPPVLCVGAPPADGSAVSVEAVVLL